MISKIVILLLSVTLVLAGPIQEIDDTNKIESFRDVIEIDESDVNTNGIPQIDTGDVDESHLQEFSTPAEELIKDQEEEEEEAKENKPIEKSTLPSIEKTTAPVTEAPKVPQTTEKPKKPETHLSIKDKVNNLLGSLANKWGHKQTENKNLPSLFGPFATHVYKLLVGESETANVPV